MHAPQPHPVKQMRAVASGLIEDGRADEAVETLLEALSELVRQNAELSLLLQKLRASSRGATSERVSAEQLSLLALLLESVDDGDESAPDSAEEARQDAALDAEIAEAADAAADDDTTCSDDESDDSPGETKKTRTRNRWLDQEALDTEIVDHEPPADQQDWERIGTEQYTRLRFQPARFYKEIHRVPVMRNPALDADGNTEIVADTTGVPPTLRPGSLAAADVIAGLIVNKYERHLPLHRISRAAMADQGIHLPVSTLADWAADGGAACQRIAAVIGRSALQRWLVRTDATGLRVLDAAGATRGTIWCYVGWSREPDEPPDVCFVYTPTGQGETGPWAMLAGREGYVQADALNIYDRVFNGEVASAIEVGCLAHGRRKFVELMPAEHRAAYVVQLIRRAYRIETLADNKRLTVDERTELRQTRTRPLFERKLLPYLERLKNSDVPTAPIVGAATYMTNHWAALTRFLGDGGLPLDNNFVESQLRAVRLGENNYLFAGSHEAAARTAAVLTVLATCRAHGANTSDYLEDLFTRLARPIARDELETWTPGRWVQRRRAT